MGGLYNSSSPPARGRPPSRRVNPAVRFVLTTFGVRDDVAFAAGPRFPRREIPIGPRALPRHRLNQTTIKRVYGRYVRSGQIGHSRDSGHLATSLPRPSKHVVLINLTRRCNLRARLTKRPHLTYIGPSTLLHRVVFDEFPIIHVMHAIEYSDISLIDRLRS